MSQNGWLYSLADPVNRLDPSGRYSQAVIKRLLGVPTYMEAVEVFQSGYLMGQWGLLEVLRRAGNRDMLEVYEFVEQPCLLQALPTPDPWLGPSFRLQSIRTMDDALREISESWSGSLNLSGSQLVLASGGLLGTTRYDVLGISQHADYFRLQNVTGRGLFRAFGAWFETYAQTRYVRLELVADQVDWPELLADVSRLAEFGIDASGHPEAARLIRFGPFLNEMFDVWQALQPVLRRMGEEQNPADLSRLVREAVLAHGIPVPTREGHEDVPFGSFLSLLENLGGAIRNVP